VRRLSARPRFRAGLIVIRRIETIDATAADTSLLGHSYFAEARSVLSDIFYLVCNGHRVPWDFRSVNVNRKTFARSELLLVLTPM
jgi:hypothetical protein